MKLKLQGPSDAVEAGGGVNSKVPGRNLSNALEITGNLAYMKKKT